MHAMRRIEDAARMAMADPDLRDPLPPGPNYGPFGYFRLAVLIFLAFAAFLYLITVF